ncbi:Uncharacterized protein ACMD2_18882 [Ananas comosus]|uniref:Uncharacterized protein n=1 Tax=Ananas comosus TaxID=4615 RepID=A0A199UJZ9_ANACO|nr:Uncharacterized protein ACMD2_18882 [Ananas comosus]
MDPRPAAEEEGAEAAALFRRLSIGGGGGGNSSAAAASAAWLEIRLFYVRVAPCAVEAAPPRLTLAHLRARPGGARDQRRPRPAAERTAVALRRDRLDRAGAGATYVGTDGVRLAGAALEFEVSDDRGNLILCGALERVEAPWSNGAIGFPDHLSCSSDRDPRTGWTMDCYSAASIASSAFAQPKLGISSPSIEVYVAGCFAGVPLILSQTIQLSPRRKPCAPEGSTRFRRTRMRRGGGRVAARVRSPEEHPRLVQFIAFILFSVVGEEEEENEYDPEMKVGHNNYPDGWYTDEDGQLSWFNAGVRVGVGIGLGMCVGIGIGVGLLMRSYQATTRSFKRRFF